MQQEVLDRLGELAAQQRIGELEDEDSARRAVAAWMLGCHGHTDASDALLDRATDPDRAVRWAATWALGRLGDRERLTHVFDRLTDMALWRTEMVGALAMTFKDLTDRRLLSMDLDNVQPYWDPQVPIDADRARDAAWYLHLAEEEVKRRYESIAQVVPPPLLDSQ